MAEPSESYPIARIKGEMRREDQRRLAAGEVTPEELQRENALIPIEAAQKAVVHFDLAASQRTWENLLRLIEPS